VQPIAGDALRDLGDIGLGVAQHDVAESLVAVELRQQRLGIHSQGGSGGLHDVLGLIRLPPAHEGVDADHLPAADHARLAGPAVGHGHRDRDQASPRKINVLDRLVGPVQNLAMRKLDRVHVRTQPILQLVGHHGKQKVLF
jgi:hypothetical protein